MSQPAYDEDTECDDTVPAHEAVVKKCGCGRVFTQAQWDALPYGWREPGWDVDGAEVLVEYRNCYCTSTIGIAVMP